jgi:hypothetical protein
MISCAPLTARAKLGIRSFIAEMMPSWRGFQVVEQAKYLGFWIGPAASPEKNFQAPADKFFKRILSISLTPFSSRAAAVAANRDAVPTLSYVAQLIEPQPKLLNLQLAYNCKTLKIPYRALRQTIYNLKYQLGIACPVSLGDLCLASRIRTANKTLDQWSVYADLLAEAFEEHAFLSQIRANSTKTGWMSPEHWQMKPFAQALAECVIYDVMDARFQTSVYKRLNQHTVQALTRCLHDQPVCLQAAIYKQLIQDCPESDFGAFLEHHNLRHFRKAKAEDIDRLCDLICCHSSAIIAKLARCRNKYGTLSIVKFLSDSLCVPARFGQRVCCPYCKSSSSDFSLMHLVACEACINTILNTLSSQDRDKISSVCRASPRLIFLRLISCMHVMPNKLILSIASLFATLALSIASFVASPEDSLPAHFKRLTQVAI